MKRSLESLSQQVAKNDAERLARSTTQRPRLEVLGGDSVPAFHAMMSSLLSVRERLRTTCEEASWPNTEVEVRIGMVVKGCRRWQSLKSNCFPGSSGSGAYSIDEDSKRTHGVEFIAGIDQAHAERLPAIFGSDKYTRTATTEQVVRIAEKIRYDATPGAPMRLLEEKTKILRTDIAMFAYHYDLRIDCNLERPLSGGVPDGLQSKWEKERRKSRTTFKSINPRYALLSYLTSRHRYCIPLILIFFSDMWKVDVTTVISKKRDPSTGEIDHQEVEDKSYELEIELENAAMIRWLTCSTEQEYMSMTKAMTEELLRLINECVPCHLKQGTELELVPDNQFVSEATRVTNAIVPGFSSGAPFAFAGSMPFSMSRKSLDLVCKSTYFVTEKTDGKLHK